MSSCDGSPYFVDTRGGAVADNVLNVLQIHSQSSSPIDMAKVGFSVVILIISIILFIWALVVFARKPEPTKSKYIAVLALSLFLIADKYVFNALVKTSYN